MSLSDIKTLAQSLVAKATTDYGAYDAKVAARDAEIVTLKKRIAELEAPIPTPVPTPVPAPAPTGFWYGVNTVWPNADNTGPRIAVTAATSNNVSGLVKGKRFTGTVYPSSGTVFEDCEFVGAGGWGIDGDGRRFKLTNCLLHDNGRGGPAAILGIADVINCEIRGYYDAIKPQGSGWIIRGNYIHSPYAGGTDPHNDGIQASGPHDNGLIEQNWIKWRDTSAVFLHPGWGPITNCTVRHNFLGGADMPLRIDGTGCKAIENMIERGHWGSWDFAKPVEHRGNIAPDGTALD